MMMSKLSQSIKAIEKYLIPAFLSVILLFSGIQAFAENAEAVDIAKQCSVEVSTNKGKRSAMFSKDYKSYWEGKDHGTIHVKVKKGTSQGIQISFYGDAPEICVTDKNGNIIAEKNTGYRTEYIPFFSPCSDFTVSAAGDGVLKISSLKILSEGTLPGWVQRWETLEPGTAELMLVSAHLDDELLWFGGMLPYYAGENGRRVIVVYMAACGYAYRVSELLDGLWHCGVKWYPELGTFPDKGASSLASTQRNWGEGAAALRITHLIRKYRPAVIVTHDINGEYGHFHHIETANAVIASATRYASDPGFDAGCGLEPWQVQKLYIHLLKENAIRMDWRTPLSAFNGETGLSVARQAFKMHISQQTGRYAVNDSGRMDCSLFGLYYSAVGEDIMKNDLFENIPD